PQPHPRQRPRRRDADADDSRRRPNGLVDQDYHFPLRRPVGPERRRVGRPRPAPRQPQRRVRVARRPPHAPQPGAHHGRDEQTRRPRQRVRPQDSPAQTG
ncbi:hypothetical protein BN1708_016941, partial [Verticillium longisporum]